MKQNIEFERCIDFLVRMIDKYGEELLRELEEDKENNGQVQFAPSGGRKCVFQRPLCGAERPLVFS